MALQMVSYSFELADPGLLQSQRFAYTVQAIVFLLKIPFEVVEGRTVFPDVGQQISARDIQITREDGLAVLRAFAEQGRPVAVGSVNLLKLLDALRLRMEFPNNMQQAFSNSADVISNE